MGTGKIFVIEGTDFSGKTTQYELLLKRFKENGQEFFSSSFPNYESSSSFFVTEYLRGTYGTDAEKIEPKKASVFYALDRYHSYHTQAWGNAYNQGKNILFSRYISSNILHQACKYNNWEKAKEFIKWLYDFEVGFMGIPKEDQVFFLDMPTEKIQELKTKRLKEQHGLSSNGSIIDIHESNLDMLKRSHDLALKVADYLKWTIIPCAKNKELRQITEINEELFSKINIMI